nr:hypothetical protein [Candidatus Sigynarchaeota archaeon]
KGYINSTWNDVLKIIQNVTKNVKEWNNAILLFATDGTRFANAHLEKPESFDGDLALIVRALDQIEENWRMELKAKMGEKYDEDISLSENAGLYMDDLNGIKKDLEDRIKSMNRVQDDLSNYQGDYKKTHKEYTTTRHLLDKAFPIIHIIGSQIKNNINLENIDTRIMKEIANQARMLYKGITGEDSLLIAEEIEQEKGGMYLTFSIKLPDGSEIPVLDDDPSGSEQASISLGAMYALAKFFKACVVMDEVSDKFDHETKKNFYDAINLVARDVVTMIVLKVDRPDDEIEDELDEMRDAFKDAIFIQTSKRDDGMLAAKVLEKSSEFKRHRSTA